MADLLLSQVLSLREPTRLTDESHEQHAITLGNIRKVKKEVKLIDLGNPNFCWPRVCRLKRVTNGFYGARLVCSEVLELSDFVGVFLS